MFKSMEASMKRLFVLTALALSMNAFAGDVKVSFTHWGNNAGTQSYYSCDYVEGQAEMYLETFGATDIEVTCTGGIGPGWTARPVSVWASFNLPVLSGQDVAEIIKVEGDPFRPSCALNVQMIKSFLKVMPHISVIKKRDACAFASSNYYFELAIQR